MILSTPFSTELCYSGMLLHVALILQAVGLIAAIGESVNDLKVGTPVAIMTFGSYAEFTMVNNSLSRINLSILVIVRNLELQLL